MSAGTAERRTPRPVERLGQALPIAKWLHWLTASAIFFLFVFGILMTQIGGGALADWLYSAHKSLGLLVIVLLAARLAYRGMSSLGGRWRSHAGNRALHAVIYGLTLVVALLGWAGVSDFGARTVFFGLKLPSIWPEGAGHSAWFFPAHVWLAFLLMALILIHIGMAVNDYVTRRVEG
jgi:cytochrome b561